MDILALPAGRREWLGVAASMLPCLVVVMELSVLLLAVPSLTERLRPTHAERLWITDVHGVLIVGALMVPRRRASALR